eukprot:11202340-Lingulodinium_polyedra.AAC.1
MYHYGEQSSVLGNKYGYYWTIDVAWLLLLLFGLAVGVRLVMLLAECSGPSINFVVPPAERARAVIAFSHLCG